MVSRFKLGVKGVYFIKNDLIKLVYRLIINICYDMDLELKFKYFLSLNHIIL